MQPESAMQETPSTPAAPKKSFPILTVVLIVALIGVAVWAVMLNSQLGKTQAALSAEQGKSATLTTEKDKLSSDLTNTKSKLEQTTSDLEATQSDLDATKKELDATKADLKKAQDEAAAYKSKNATASARIDVLYKVFTIKSTADLLAVDSAIKALNDKALLDLWNKFLAAPTVENSANFELALIESIQDTLK